MKKNKKLLLTLFLITWVLFAVVTFFNHANNFLGKSYFDSESFLSRLDNYKENLNQYVLQPLDVEEAKRNISVTEEEIDYYRNYYGTLSDQIANIKSQYEQRIEEAESIEDKNLKKSLIVERDKKIDDVTKNFKSDEYVIKKIKVQKEKIIEEYGKRLDEEKRNFLQEDTPFVYNLINVDTGEVFKNGEIDSSNAFKRVYGGKEPNLTFNRTYYAENYSDNPGVINGIDLGKGSSQFKGTIVIPTKMLQSLSYGNEYQTYNVAKTLFYIVWISGVVALIGLLTKFRPTKEMFSKSNVLKKYFLKLPIDVRIVIVIVDGLFTLECFSSLGHQINYNGYYYLSGATSDIVLDLILGALVLVLPASTTILGVMWFIESINSEEKLVEQGNKALVYRLSVNIKDLFLKRSVAIQILIILIGVFIEGMLFAGSMAYGGELLFFFIACTLFIAIPVVLHFVSRLGYLNRIMKDTEDMVEGRLTKDIKVKGKSAFAKHAANLNVLREKVKNSKSEQAKSERLKTELITNVSHDLRTPLTSIITYTDLLKNPNLSEQERTQYIEILDKKSARLKTLIEDLFEVSKMASGSIELTKQKIDVAQLLQQAIGEHKESFTKNSLDLRVSVPEVPLLANVDGQKLWRVMDNLIINVLKYSLEGTRIYISLGKSEGNIVFTIKNVSKYELSENVGELTERFKRADASRNTEGSGLGLAIAQSIIDLHGGNLMIDVDGDLFKVTVSIPTE